MSSSSSTSSIPISILGWVNKEKAIDGLRRKQLVEVASSEQESKVKSLVESADENIRRLHKINRDNDPDYLPDYESENEDDEDEKREKNVKSSSSSASVYIRRQYFPIFPSSFSSSTSTSSEDKKDSPKIVSIAIIDEPTPQIRHRKTIVETTDEDEHSSLFKAMKAGGWNPGSGLGSAKAAAKTNRVNDNDWGFDDFKQDFEWTSAPAPQEWVGHTTSGGGWGSTAAPVKKAATKKVAKKAVARKAPAPPSGGLEWNWNEPPDMEWEES